MKKHVELLGLLYMISGALSVLLGLSFLALGFGAAAIITTAEGEGSGMVAGVTAVTFTIIAALAFAWGGAHVLTGAAIRRHRPWARLAGLAMALLNLLLLPFGTALGVYGLWVLLNDQSRQLFEPAASGAALG